MKKNLRYTWSVLTKAERKKFLWLLLPDILVNLADVFSVFLLLVVISHLANHTLQNIPFVGQFFFEWNEVSLIIFLAVLFTLKNVCAMFAQSAQFKFSGTVSNRLSGLQLAHIQQLPYLQYVQTGAETHIKNAGIHPIDFSQHLLSGLQQIITQICLISITVIFILCYNASVFLLLLIVLLPVSVIIFFILRKKMIAYRKQMAQENAQSFRYLSDAVQSYAEANVYHRQDFFLQRFVNSRKSFSKAFARSLTWQQFPARLIEVMAIFGLLGVFLLLKWNSVKQDQVLITLGAFMAAAYKIIPGVVKLINLLAQFRSVETGEVLQELSQENAVIKNNEPVNLEVKHICFSYHQQEIIHDFSAAFSKGKMIGISGASGVGKTTLINLLLGFIEPSSGEILWNGKNVTAEILRQNWPSIAYVPQQTLIIQDTIENNIALGASLENVAHLQEVIQACGLNPLLKELSDGLQTILAADGKNISGGQRQRIALARALYKNPNLYLLDEPFSELDAASIVTLQMHFLELCEKGKTVVIISHDELSLSYCNTIIALEKVGR